MLPDRVSNPGPLTYESGALPIALRGPTFLKTNDLVLVSLTISFCAGLYDILILQLLTICRNIKGQLAY